MDNIIGECKFEYFNSKIIKYYYKYDEFKKITLVYSCYEFDNQDEHFTLSYSYKIANVSESDKFIDTTSVFINTLNGLEYFAFIIKSSYKLKIYVLDINLKISKYACSFSSKSQSNNSIGSVKVIDGPKIVVIFENKLLMASMNSQRLNFTKYKLSYDIQSILWSQVNEDKIMLILEMNFQSKNSIFIYESIKSSDFKCLMEINISLCSNYNRYLKKILEFQYKLLVLLMLFLKLFIFNYPYFNFNI